MGNVLSIALVVPDPLRKVHGRIVLSLCLLKSRPMRFSHEELSE